MKLKVLQLWYLIILLMATGCKHKDLCYNHSHGTQARIHVNWKGSKEIPTGMSVTAYSCRSKDFVNKQTNTISYADLFLKEDMYQVLVYNQSPSEFGTFSFKDLDSFEKASVIAVNRTKTWYNRAESERVIHDPEWLASGVMKELEIIDTVTYHSIVTRGSDIFSLSKDTIYPKSRIYTLNVTVHVKGLQNLRSIRGSLNGMAAGCYLSSGSPIREEATQLLEEWKKIPSTEHPTEGKLICTIPSFGLPMDHQEIDVSNKLKLSALLIDNKTIKDFEFNVGKRFEYSSEVNLELDLEIGTDIDNGPIEFPEVKPSGGFDVDVDNWDEEEIEIPIP